MKREAVAVLLGIALGAAALFLVRHLRPDPDDAKALAERHTADSLYTAALQDNQRLTHTVATLSQELLDTSAYHRQREATFKATADQRGHRITFLEDSLVTAGKLVRPATGGPPIPAPNATQADSAALLVSCLQLYTERTGEVGDLREALSECQQKASADSTRAKLTTDTLGTANGRLAVALFKSDSARKAEINRPRPCRRDFLLWHPSCTTADLLLLGTGAVIGWQITR